MDCCLKTAISFVKEMREKRRLFAENNIKKALFCSFPHDAVFHLTEPVWIPKMHETTAFCRLNIIPKQLKGCDRMTETQKAKIFSMRMQGIGYHVIGSTLNLDENQVQQYCKTHGLAGEAGLVSLNHAVWCEQNNRCVFCGSKLEQPRTGRRKRFCSGNCRTKYCLLRKNCKTITE